jgi:hypothetical protein
MTSAESTLLGILIGALFSWVGSTLSSRTQWQREKWRHQTDRRSDLYQDMFMRTRRLIRLQKLHNMTERTRPTPDEVIELDRWTARVELFASREVDALWDAWFNVHMEGWEILRTKLESLEDRRRYAEHGRRRQAAHAALVDQMRRELEGKPVWKPKRRRLGRAGLTAGTRPELDG